MRMLLCWVLGLVTASVASAQFSVPVAKPQRPLPAVEHVVIISIDGLRPDRLLLANTPTLRGMISTGTYTFWAKTTAVSTTLPSHASMLTGVIPRKHGLEFNRDLPLSEPVYPSVPTIFEMATKVGYDTAIITSKSKFRALNKPGTIVHVDIPAVGVTNKNDEVAASASKIIEAFKPALTFIHFAEVDAAGHKYGWGSHEQLAAIEHTDGNVAQVLEALERAGIRESTFIVVTADHGGAGLTHGADDPRSRHIPWIVTGPGVRKFFDLTQMMDLEVRTEDTTATTCWLLGLPQQPNFDGKPVLAVFEKVP